MVKFALVGLANTFLGYALYAAFIYLGLSFILASLLTIVLSIAFGYFTQGKLVFGEMSRFAFARFVLVWVVIYVVYVAIVTAARSAGMNNYLGGLIATPFVAVLSYLMQRHIVFVAEKRSRI